jgi:Protein of unknown function (DUF3570)
VDVDAIECNERNGLAQLCKARPELIPQNAQAQSSLSVMGQWGSSLMKAAMGLPIALPGVLMMLNDTAYAESAPDKTLVSLKYLDYLDSQPGFDRIRVRAPSALLIKPLSSEWSISSTYTADAISGASPAFHTQALKNMHDERHALDLSATRYTSLGTQTFGGSYSKEVDYLSRGVFFSMTQSDESKNTTWNAGVSLSSDQINPTNHVVMNETKQSYSLIAGVTQVLDMDNIAQLQLGHYSGKGDYSDPYKVFDNRPRERVNNTFLARWNHFFANNESTLRMSYRYYEDNWGIQAHTLDAEWVKPTGGGWTFSPSVRLYSQSAANFYVDADTTGSPFPPFPSAGSTYYSEDQRVSAYGAHTFGFKVVKYLDADTWVDFKVEQYQQRGSWKLFGAGSQGLDPMMARSIQVGYSHYF